MPRWPDVKPRPYHTGGESRYPYWGLSPLITVSATGERRVNNYDAQAEDWEYADVVTWFGTRWIPCTEALPEVNGDPDDEDSRSRPVLVRVGGDSPGEAYRAYVTRSWDFEADAMGNRWASMDDACDCSAIVERMEIPE